jgi:carbonic anhydrase
VSATETVIERNEGLSSELSEKHFTITPDLRVIVLTCADHRVDPAYVLGLELGEAVVVRNPGGRVNPAFIQNLAVLRSVAVAEGFEPGFELIVMHHTDCGLTRLDGPDYSGLMAAYMGTEEDALAEKHLGDPREAVRTDIEALRANPFLPPALVVSGIVYDLDSGLLEVVCPPRALGDQD